MKCEYKVIKMDIRKSDIEIECILNKYAEERWEYVDNVGMGGYINFIFKRIRA